MNGADSELRRQLPTTAARENDCNVTQVTSVLCRIWRPSRTSIFCNQSYFCRLSILMRDLIGHCYVHFDFIFTLSCFYSLKLCSEAYSVLVAV